MAEVDKGRTNKEKGWKEKTKRECGVGIKKKGIKIKGGTG